MAAAPRRERPDLIEDGVNLALLRAAWYAAFLSSALEALLADPLAPPPMKWGRGGRRARVQA